MVTMACSENAMNKTLTLLPLTLLLATEVALAQVKQPAATPDLPKVQARAAMHNKRVVVVLRAADDDYLTQLKRNASISRKLSYEFETAVYAGEAGAKQWHWQTRDSGVVVLDAAGKEMARFSAAELEGKEALAKLEPLFCKPVDAEQKLAMALVEAKQTGRNILVRFDAPW